VCQQCCFKVEVLEHLNQHASETKHEAFRCSELNCVSRFTRLDDLRRHQRKHTPYAHRFHCIHCPTESKSFSRKDHLTQHLRNFHRIGLLSDTSTARPSCPHSFCPQFRDADDAQTEAMPFRTSKEYNDHMRKVHSETPFPCPEIGCHRLGANGYFREMDLVKHRRKKHPNSGSEGDSRPQTESV